MQISGDIIVGIDGSRSCREAAAWALKEARHHDCGLRLISVVSPENRKFGSLGEAQDASANALATISEQLRALVPEAEFETVIEQGDPAEVLAARSEKAGLVVIGHHGSDQEVGGRIGTISFGLPGHALSPVLVYRESEDSEFDSADSHVLRGGGVVVGHDTSDYAGVAALDAADYASRTGAALRMVVATQADGDERDRAQTDLDMAWLRSQYPGLTVSAEYHEGDAAAVLAARSADADLLVIGKRGLGRFASMRVQLGRTASRVLHDAQCSLLLVPFREDPALALRRFVD
ncbi:universal stress protein [Brevibacterium daeguense]|nr:universal stress protein [Brevibacterium daeguense]